jgi:predicted nucleic acid-binding protein
MVNVFFDTSVLFAAAYSATGAARDLVRLAAEGNLVGIVSEDVLEETERNLRKKAPDQLPAYRVLLAAFDPLIIATPSLADIARAAHYTAAKDAPIVAAAIQAKPDYFVTYDRKHLLDAPEVAEQSGLTIVTPDVVVRAVAATPREPDETDPNGEG